MSTPDPPGDGAPSATTSPAAPQRPAAHNRFREVDDGTLVAGIVARSPEALEEAYRRCAGAVFGLARRVLRDPASAEDVTQEVFLRLWSAPDRFDAARGSLQSFLVAQGHGRSVDVVRAETSRRGRERRDAVIDLRGRDDDVVSAVCATSIADRLRSSLQRLPPREREAISLAYFGGNTYCQVADLLSTPEGTVKARIRSGLRRLAADLA